MPLILVIENERRLRAHLRATLSGEHFRIAEAARGDEGLHQVAVHNPDVVVLGLRLPDMDGIDVTTQLRERTAVPIVLLSAPGEETEKVAALDAGANDHLKKPFDKGEFLECIWAWLRQSQRTGRYSLNSVLDVGDLRIDSATRLAFVGKREVRLTPIQYKLLRTLMRSAGKILTHEELLFRVWGPAYTKETPYLRVFMAQLRRKLEKDPAHPRRLMTEPHVGYGLRKP
jgi:two-component system KDP operon response regulator KdpE